jgi:acetyltransferase-like isoleucine patch superfamily enzyme
MISKIIWFLRFIIYRFLFYRSFSGFIGYLGHPTYISGLGRARFGSRFRMFPGARIEVFPLGSLYVENNVSIAQNVHITCAKEIHIGENTIITRNVTITDILHTRERDKPLSPKNIESSPTKIGKNVFIGVNAVIDRGSIIGDGAIIGANTYVKGVVAKNTIYYKS